MTRYEWLQEQVKKMKQLPMLPQACIEWPHSTRWTGHGQIVEYRGRQDGHSIQKAHRVHRLAYEWYYGRKPKRKILHTCDNPACYNPAHLYEGSQKQNMADKEQRSDANHTGPKLTEAKALEIYRLSHSGITQQEIADQFGVSIPTVSAIKNGRTWSHLPRPEEQSR